MSTPLSRDFTLEEFSTASQRPLSAAEVEAATWWARRLQPIRDRVGCCLVITSYVRSTKPYTGVRDLGAHSTGDAVDVVPRGNISVRALADLCAYYYLNAQGGSGDLVQVIDERTHVHLARRLAPGALAGYLQEPREGEYVATVPDPARINKSDYRVLVAGAAVLGALALTAR